MFIRKRSLFLLLALVVTGCSTTQTNRLYYAVANLDASDSKRTQTEIKLYRITIITKARNMKTELFTGFYDANAVRSLYGEVKKSETTETEPVGNVKFQLKDGHWEMADPKQLFTIVFGADAKAISGLIKTYTEGTEFGNQVGSLIAAAASGDRMQRAAAINLKTNQEKSITAATAAELRRIAADIEALKGQGAAGVPKLQAKILEAEQLMANSLGSTKTIGSGTDARSVYAELLKEEME